MKHRAPLWNTLSGIRTRGLPAGEVTAGAILFSDLSVFLLTVSYQVLIGGEPLAVGLPLRGLDGCGGIGSGGVGRMPAEAGFEGWAAIAGEASVGVVTTFVGSVPSAAVSETTAVGMVSVMVLVLVTVVSKKSDLGFRSTVLGGKISMSEGDIVDGGGGEEGEVTQGLEEAPISATDFREGVVGGGIRERREEGEVDKEGNWVK